MAYEIFYLITGVLMLYTWYILIAAFSEKQQQPVAKLVGVMSTYYIVSNLISVYVEIILLNLILTILVISAIAALLNKGVKKIIYCVVRTMLILMGVDLVVFAIEGFYIDSVLEPSEYHSVVGRLIAIVVVYSLGIGIRNLKHIRKDVEIPRSYWLTLGAFPVISIVIFQLMLRFSGYESETVIIIVFLIYDHLMALYEQRFEDLSLFYVNESYKKQLETMTKSVNVANGIQHDISRHITSISTLLQGDRYVEAKKYLAEIQHEFSENAMLCRSGNPVVDSIVNYEFSLSGVNVENVMINVDSVPNKVLLTDYELTIVLSNLLRNAFQAVSLLEGGKVSIVINYGRGMLFIKVVNDYDGVIYEQDGELESRYSKESNVRGLGIKNVKKVIEKHEGDIELIISDSQFDIEVLLYT